LHPLHVESVAWVAERKDVLSAFFGLGTLVAYRSYTTHRTYRTYALCLLLFALGLMSKPMLVTLPLVMLLLDYWPLGQLAISNWRSAIRPLAVEKIPFLMLSAASCVVTFVVQRKGGAVQSLSSYSLSERIANALVSYERYLGKTFWPVDLAVPYPHPGHWPAGQVILAAGVIVSLCVVALWSARKFPFVTTGWFWFFGMMIPAIGLVQVGDQSMADRYTYLPLIGIFIIFVWGVGEAVTRWRLSPGWTGAAAGVLMAACIVATRNQLRCWENSETLFRRALAVTDKNSLAHNNLGNALFDRGQVNEAILQFQKALEIQPNYIDAHINLGNALRDAGRPDDAIVQFQAALRLQPDSAEAHYNFGNLCLQTGKTDDAIVHFRAAAESSADHVMARNNLANTLLQKGEVDEAIRFYREALQIRPDFVAAHHNLGGILLRRGQADEAVAHFRKVVELQPGSANVYNNLGWMLRQTGRYDESAIQLEQALKLQPDYPEAHVNLAKTLLLLGKAPEAVSHLRTALKLQADDRRTLADLAWVLATWPDATVRNGVEATELARQAIRLSNGEDAAALEALAAAQAECGKYGEAAETARRALTAADSQANPALVETLRVQLERFQSNAPLREKILLPGN
jgi:tetratricopeptide (TPR) repeat protein